MTIISWRCETRWHGVAMVQSLLISTQCI